MGVVTSQPGDGPELVAQRMTDALELYTAIRCRALFNDLHKISTQFHEPLKMA